jgi:hypothetical protein
VKWRPLRAAYVGATLSTLGLALLSQPAAAHVDIRPRLVEQGAVAELVVELPRLRPGAAPQRLDVEGPGLDVLSTALRGAVGSETQWNVRLRADTAPGTVPIVLRAMYADGRAVTVRNSLTVVPGEQSESFPWAWVGGGVAVAVGAAAGALALARRRSW